MFTEIESAKELAELSKTNYLSILEYQFNNDVYRHITNQATEGKFGASFEFRHDRSKSSLSILRSFLNEKSDELKRKGFKVLIKEPEYSTIVDFIINWSE